MAIIGDALRQAFMPKNEYESLLEEEKPLPSNVKGGGAGDSDMFPGELYLTDQETAYKEGRELNPSLLPKTLQI
ncbi:hypothetical protein GQ457_06G003630 [Hibiscus cannabinus]